MNVRIDTKNSFTGDEILGKINAGMVSLRFHAQNDDRIHEFVKLLYELCTYSLSNIYLN